MKKCISIFLAVLFLFNLSCFANDSTALQQVQDSMRKVSTDLASIKAKVSTVDSNLQSIKDTLHQSILTGWIPVDTAQLSYAEKNAKTVLYQESIFKKKKQLSQPTLSYIIAALSFVLLLLLWYKAADMLKNSAICKDQSFYSDQEPVPAKYCSYSYSRVQLFWWTMIILSTYIFFYGMTGVLVPLNATTVALLGCGLLVHAVGKTMDNRQIAQMKGFRNQDNHKSHTAYEPNFFKDILSDDNGISVHRFQSMVFNMVFGIGFISNFVKQISLEAYPFADFSEWQFALIGISSATYLGLKATENTNTSSATAAPAKENPNTASEGEVAAPRAINKF